MRKLFFVFAISILLSGCEFWEVDKCLDQGGRWNYEKKKCEFEENMQLENKPTSDRGKED